MKLCRRFSMMVSLLFICSMVLQTSGVPIFRLETHAQARSILSEVAQLAAAPNTVELTTIGATPTLLEVTVGQTVTLTNKDSVALSLRLVFTPGGSTPSSKANIYLPLIVRGAAANTTAEASETITLNAGESVTRVYDQVGNVVIFIGTATTPAATLLITPIALVSDGSVEGKLLDFATKLPLEGAQVKALDTEFVTTTDSQGQYQLPLPPGIYTLVMFANGYTFANREVMVQAFSPVAVDPIELVPLDSKVDSIGETGGTATNSAGNTNVVFASGAVTSTKAVRLTDLPVDEFKPDFAALPGPFTDGRIPLGFVKFDPEGVTFGADAVWTIAYDGPLAVGTDVPCYYWLEAEATWGDPVPGKVVDLGGGKKGLRATLPHFSSYGFAAIPPLENKPPIPPKNTNEEDNPNASKPENNVNCGSQVNLMTGQLCQTIGTLGLPSVGGLPTQIIIKYQSLRLNNLNSLNNNIIIQGEFTRRPGGAFPIEDDWKFEIAGRVFTGTGSFVNVSFDGRDSHGRLLQPGGQQGTMTSNWQFLDRTIGRQIFVTNVPWTVQIRRNDQSPSPFGRGWFSPHDQLLIDRGLSVTVIQGDGRQLTFEHTPKQRGRLRVLATDEFIPPVGEFSKLTHNDDGTWTRTFPDGSTLTFNTLGRLSRIADRYGNTQILQYESNGKILAEGEWGLTTRIRRIIDSSSNSFEFGYDVAGLLATITDSVGRVYRYEHDSAGNLTASIDPLGQKESFGYDAKGFMNSHTDKQGNQTTYVLDDKGRLISRTWPTKTTLKMNYESRKTTMTPDSGGPIVATMDEAYNPISTYNGVYTMTINYNDQQQPETRDTPPQTTLYDKNGEVITVLSAMTMQIERDGTFNQPSRVTSSDGNDTKYDYDTVGNLVQFTDALGQSYGLSYDSHGQPLSITDPLGQTTTMQYNEQGLVTTLTDALNRQIKLSYDKAGNVATMIDPLNQQTSMEYDALNRLTGIVDAFNGRTAMSYDANGNPTEITDPDGRKLSYGYDSLDHLTQMTYPDGNAQSYQYDAIGNIVGLTDARGKAIKWSYDAANRPIKKEVTGGPTTTYQYDNLNQLTAKNEGTLTVSRSYITNTVNKPTFERQQAKNIPLNVLAEYDFGLGYQPHDDTFELGYEQLVTPGSLGPGSGIIGDSGTKDIYTFRGTMSETIQLWQHRISGTGSPIIEIHTSNGKLLNYSNTGGGEIIGRRYILPESGTYHLWVYKSGVNNTGTYSLYLQSLTKPLDPAVTLNRETMLTGTISVAPKANFYTFSGVMSETVQVWEHRITSAIGLNVEIYTPDGKRLTGSVQYPVGGYKRYTLPQTGTYQIWVYDSYGDNTGSYNLYLQSLTKPLDPLVELNRETILTDTITVPPKVNFYTFSGTMSETIRILGHQNGIVGLFEVHQPNDINDVCSGYMYSFEDCILPQTGAYQLWVYQNGSYTNTGSYDLYLQSLTNPLDTPVALSRETLVTGTISIAPKVNFYTFSGTMSETVQIWEYHSTTSSFSALVEVYAPNGKKLNAIPVVSYDRYILPQTGSYQLWVSESGGDNTGNYNLYLQSVTNPINPPIALTRGVTTTGAIAVGPKTDFYTFTGNAAEKVQVRFTNSGGLDAFVEIAGADGKVACSNTNSPISCTLPQTSSYQLRIYDTTGLKTGSYAIYLQTVAARGNLAENKVESPPTVIGDNPQGQAKAAEIRADKLPLPEEALPPIAEAVIVPMQSSATLTTPRALPNGGRLVKTRLTSNNNNVWQSTAYNYDAIGQVTTLQSQGYSTYTVAYQYDKAGRLTGRGGTPLNPNYGYDAANQLTNLAFNGSLLSEQYQYDAAGNLTQVVSSRDGTTQYGYDKLNRLVKANDTVYGYDAAGNRTQAGNVTYSYNSGGQLVSASDGTIYSYDKQGNLTSRVKNGQTTQFTWDGQNRLTRIDYADRRYSAYQYDDSGRRISKRLPDGTMLYYVYQGDNLAQELDSTGQVIASYVYDGLDHPISMWRGGQTYFYLLDRLGNVLGLTDSAGQIVVSYRYDAWGNLLNQTGTLANPFRFTGREYDEESGLYFYRARYYDPQAGRFISRDPIGVMGGLNLYAYVGNNPVNRIDLRGTWITTVTGGGIGAIAGGVEYYISHTGNDFKGMEFVAKIAGGAVSGIIGPLIPGFFGGAVAGVAGQFVEDAINGKLGCKIEKGLYGDYVKGIILGGAGSSLGDGIKNIMLPNNIQADTINAALGIWASLTWDGVKTNIVD